MDAQVLANVKRAGYTVPTPIQKNAIPILAAKRDLMACAQTGSGKTAAFLLPMINAMIKEPRAAEDVGYPQAVIVTPTRELCLQVSEYSLSSTCHFINPIVCPSHRSTKREGSLRLAQAST